MQQSLRNRDIEGSIQIKGVGRELHDVTNLPGVIRPMSVGFKADEISFMFRPEARP